MVALMTRPFSSDATFLSQRRLVWLGLILAITLDTLAQLCWKLAVEQIPESSGLWSGFLHILANPLFHGALLLFLFQFANWMIVLANADLSYAQPITALSYVTVSGASLLFLHEQLSSLRLLGLAVILLGVWFISRTSHRTTEAALVHSKAQCQPEDRR